MTNGGAKPTAAVSKPGTVLCLSGGGYRAMLFHLGTLWRLNEARLFKTLTRVSSVSGGSITAAVLGMKWNELDFDDSGFARGFEHEVVAPIRELAGRSIDIPAVVKGLFLPWTTVGDQTTAAYRRFLFGTKTLQDLPTDQEGPRFVINATNLQTGSLWRFSRPYMRDYQVGEVANPKQPLARAVAASAAFPPFLSPVKLRLNPGEFTRETRALGPTGRPPFTTRVVLTDGGVYDNLGLESAKGFECVLVSDGGAKIDFQGRPPWNWFGALNRTLDVIDNQVRSLRKRHLIEGFAERPGSGTYWGIRTNLADYARDVPGLALPLACPHDRTLQLAGVPTALRALAARKQEQLINWGYAVCDAALRAFVVTTLAPPSRFVYPANPP